MRVLRQTTSAPQRKPLKRVQVWAAAFVIAIVSALAPSAVAHASSYTIWFDGNITSGTIKYSIVKYYLDGSRAWVAGEFDRPQARTTSPTGIVMYVATGGYGGGVEVVHQRSLNVKSACTFFPFSGTSTTTRMICQHIT